MKIKILTDGGFTFLKDVKKPVVVNAEIEDGKAKVSRDELFRIGADSNAGMLQVWTFTSEEFEVLP